jgi:hypothetical protein
MRTPAGAGALGRKGPCCSFAVRRMPAWAETCPQATPATAADGGAVLAAPQKLRDECLRGAKYLARLLEGLGCEVRLAAHAEGKNPVVMGRLGQ